MKTNTLLQAAIGSALITAPAMAGTPLWFTPLTQSAPVVSTNAVEETSAPWVTPAGIVQKNWVSLREVEDTVLSPGQSVGRASSLATIDPTSASMFDMMAYHPNGTHLFIPHESPVGAGVTRYNIDLNKAELIFVGDQQGGATVPNWTNDYGAFDPCRWTPNNTLFLGEEWAGLGRLVEILNPMAAVGSINFRVLESIANVSHEGINFSKKYPNTIYFVDEYNSGSIYKFVMKTVGDYTVGQTFVLSVNAFASSGGVDTENWNSTANTAATRTGAATWIPLTDADGVPLSGVTNPFTDGPSPGSADLAGRKAADDVGGTPYGRPEDMIVSRLPNGNEILYVAVTSEQSVIAIEILTPGSTRVNGTATVRFFVTASTSKNLGQTATTGTLSSPDNLAIDATGNIYIIEDAPNSSSTGGDIWFARDADNNGVAESIDHFLSIRVAGSEATGMIFNPAIPTEFSVCVQHPSSTNLTAVPTGLGDAVWSFDLSGIPNTAHVTALRRGKFRSYTNQ
jgi:hypothetical protein